MAVIEIGSPSGFVPEIPTVISEPKEKKIETEARKIVLYYDEVVIQSFLNPFPNEPWFFAVQVF